MNVMMLSLMYPEDTKKQVARDVKDKLQNRQCAAGWGVSPAIPPRCDSLRLA